MEYFFFSGREKVRRVLDGCGVAFSRKAILDVSHSFSGFTERLVENRPSTCTRPHLEADHIEQVSNKHYFPSTSPIPYPVKDLLSSSASRHHAEPPMALTPFAPLGTPVRNPCLKRRATCCRLRMRPVPVVCLRLALAPQLTVAYALASRKSEDSCDGC